ncbi:tyrosine-type recombinase/integrase [Lactobacillus sp. PV037]|uniref:tyrosine-type recombinase/integrase n=1 Tax=unclassified Lactobacillus TaxID=2620435 RepID=UPI00223E9A00|nr:MULTISPECIES: tyrosine-type recombinase/integrase [unclassified Lactobacillus]QNQ82145.1 tyrosine-type recombinase/integrase [Lactobacillus sp. PV012]QNQ83820.1 tyrosine-type recombinase/integrase [Lactobacillus sp. PV037]
MPKIMISKNMFFMILANAGTRRGEALALTWKDIDFKHNQIFLTKTVALSLSKSPVINPIKNGLSHTVPMSKSLKSTLLEYKEIQKSLGDTNSLLFHTRIPVAGRKPENQFLVRTQAAEDWIHEIYDFSDKQVKHWNAEHPDNKKSH